MILRSLFSPFPCTTLFRSVRIGDASRIRLGAHVGEGTTVMHEGFINFNAGTLGVSMVEGRISAGVVVGNGSDLGGDRKSTRLNSSHVRISYAVFCLKKNVW